MQGQSSAKAHEIRAEGLGFEPRRRFRLVVFKTTAFDRSAIPPTGSTRLSAESLQQYTVRRHARQARQRARRRPSRYDDVLDGVPADGDGAGRVITSPTISTINPISASMMNKRVLGRMLKS